MNILPATLTDIDDLAHIHIEGWRASYGGLVEQSFLDSLDKEKRAQDWATWMASGAEALIARDDAGKPAGFIAFNKLMTPPPGMSAVRPLYTAEILALYILPDYWRHGLGRRLMSDAVTRLKEKKHRSLCLWVLEKNTRAVGFYKALGGERCGKKPVEIGSRILTDICYGWRNSAILEESVQGSGQ
jgi:ribosomal protein S18 acetylase RimI-like enzyme